MPYGYYELVRFLALAGFGFLAYQARLEDKNQQVFIFVALALLFQPIFKIALGRTLWNIVDIIVAISLIASLFLEAKEKKNY